VLSVTRQRGQLGDTRLAKAGCRPTIPPSSGGFFEIPRNVAANRVPAKIQLSIHRIDRSDGAWMCDAGEVKDQPRQRTCRPREMCGDNSHARPTARRIGTAPTWPALVKPDRHASIWQREDIREDKQATLMAEPQSKLGHARWLCPTAIFKFEGGIT
jgi:hypothetical protein